MVDELKSKIGTELGIGKLHFQLFNSVRLDSVYLYDRSNEKVLMADKVSASIDLYSLMKKKVVITSAWLSDFEIHLSKETADAPLNIQYIIDAFQPKGDKPKSKIDIKISAVNIQNGRFSYDIKDKPAVNGKFDANHIAISELNAKLAMKSLASDSLNIQVKKIELKEKSGLDISALTFRLITQGKKISVRGFNMELPHSYLKLERCEVDLTPPDDSSKVIDYANLDCIIATSSISPQDISSFVPALKSFDDPVILRGHINGSVNDLRISDLSIDYGKTLHMLSNAEIKDSRDPKKTYILGSVDELTLNPVEIESILDNFSTKKTQMPELLKNLGNLSFKGDISGYLNQLTAFGSLNTDLGTVKTDILFGLNDPRPGVSSYAKGKVYTSDFDLGKLLANKDLNKTSLNIAIDVEKPTHGNLKGTAEGDIFNFDYKGYSYKDIHLDADYDGLRVNGKLLIDDINGRLDIAGLFDLTDRDMPELTFKAKVSNVQFDKLHIAENMRHSYLSFAVDADFTGRDIDHAQGYIHIDSLDFQKEDKLFLMKRFSIESSIDSLEHKLKIQSDILNGEIAGNYSFSSITNSLLETLQPYLPALIQPKDKKDAAENNLTFNFSINNTETLTDIFKLPVTVISPAKIVGRYNNIMNRFKVEVFTPVIKAAGMNIKSGYVLAENENADNVFKTRIDASIIGKKDVTNDISINSTINDNLVNTNISLVNNGKQKAKGDFSIATLFTKKEKTPLLIDIDMLPSELLLNNAMWKMEKSHINIQDGHYGVNNFYVYTNDKSQEIKINGSYSPTNSSDILKVELKDINLEYIFQTLAIDILRFGGAATGNLFVSSIENKPYLNTRLEVTDFKFNGTELGKLNIFSELDDETNKIMMDGKILSKENKLTKVNGEIDPIKQELSLNFDADSIDISFLNRYAEAIFQNVNGRGTGKVHLFGNFSDVTVEGKAFIQDGNIGIKFLNTNYKFTDTVYMKKDLIYFTDITLTDEFNNKAIASGKVAHDFFKNFMYLVDLSANNFMVYNATEQQNPIFFGKVFGSGKGTIGGDEREVDIDISMKTEDKTVVRMNFMEDVINEYSFVTYNTPVQKTDSTATATVVPSPIKTESGMDINMNFYIDATPNAVVEILMDPVGGDVLRGTGSGAMQFLWSTKSSPRLFGTYTINRGSYNFTFQRLLEKRFSIEDGSSVQFRGDPFEATLDVTAMYKITANLRDLDQDLTQSIGQTTIPVNCVLNLTGQLKHPNVGLDLQFPAADAEVARQVKSLVNTPDMINRQVAYLILLSKFYSPRDANTPYQTSDFAAVASATLSNQLTKIVSKIDDRWHLGTNIRYSDKEMTDTEFELILSSRLLNDRLLINGNFGYRNDIITKKEAMIHDVDIEYLLNNAGTWRVKAYNHYNEKFYYTQLLDNPNTQGFGIIYKRDFDSLHELFDVSKLRPKISIADTITPIVPDSTKKGSSLSHFIKIGK
ncbi:MAG: translocation/assembly module TamB [Prevotella sp.]|nr:translocation/assembly module TamB [Prevotella sp.]